MQNGNRFRAGTNRYVSEFERNITTTNENDTIRKVGHIQKMLAIVHVLGARNIRASRRGTGGQNNVLCLQPIVADGNIIFTGHNGATIKGSDACLLPVFGLGIGSTVQEFIFEGL